MPNTILVVDDNPSSVAALVGAFATSGLPAAGAHGFAHARKMLESVEPELLITGVRLGPYNGLHLVLRTRALYPNAAAILIGPADPMLASDALALGAEAYLTTHAPDAVLFAGLKSLGARRTDGDSLHLRAVSTAPVALPPQLNVSV
jgi:DNA-binding response OmpR family regulator